VTKYAATPEEWDKAVAVCRAAGICGLDTETYGHDIDETSAPYRAKVHVWSLGVLTSTVHPRGHRVAAGVVLPRSALNHRSVVGLLEDSAVVKVAHNAPHDVHSLRNEGIHVRGWVDSLPRARVMYPDWPRHGLKTLCRLVDRQLRKYEDVLTMLVYEERPCKVCVCLDPDCKKRNKSHFRVDSTKLVPVMREQPLESVVPGHTLWPDLVEYAAEDAVCAMELWDAMDNVPPTPLPPVPWAPQWNQHITEMQGAGPAETRRQ
jgi:hypothetical protein